MHTHTEGHFTLDVSGLVHFWAMPVSMFLGGGSNDGKATGKPGGSPAGRQGILDRIPSYAQVKKSSADRVRFVDLDALDRPETAKQMIAAVSTGQFKLASHARKLAFDERVLSRMKQGDWRKVRAEDLPRGE